MGPRLSPPVSTGTRLGERVGPGAVAANPKKTRPAQGRLAGRGIGLGARAFRGPGGLVTNTI